MKVWIAGILLCATGWTTVVAEEPPTAADHWHVSLDLPSLRMSDIRTRMIVRERRNERFNAHSRPGALRNFQGFWRSLVGRLFKPELRRGAWLHLVDGRLNPDWSLSATARSVMLRSPLELRCPAASTEWTCSLENDGRQMGTARIRPVSHLGLPMDDYGALLDRVEAMAEEQIYRRDALENAGWRNFISTLREDLPIIHDDLDMLVAWFGAAGLLPVSHIMLQRGGPPIEEMFAQSNGSGRELLSLEWEESVAVIRVPSFAVSVDVFAEQLADTFAQIQQASALVLDLRGNTGGNLSSMLVAAHLMGDQAGAGYFVSRSWWRMYSDEPTPERAAARLPVLDEPDLKRFFEHLYHDGGLRGQVQPRSPRYEGPVWVLIDGNTGSASEPLVWHLQHKGATLVGEPTAGAMLSSSRFDVGNGWWLILPVADYYTADGNRLEGRGVRPDHPSASDEALETALGLIRGTLADTQVGTPQ